MLREASFSLTEGGGLLFENGRGGGGVRADGGRVHGWNEVERGRGCQSERIMPEKGRGGSKL